MTDPIHPEHNQLHDRMDEHEKQLQEIMDTQVRWGKVIFGETEGGLKADEGVMGFLRSINRRQDLQTRLLQWLLGILTPLLISAIGLAIRWAF